MNIKAAVQTAQILLLLGGTELSAQAAVKTFSDRSAFLAATDANDQTGPLPNLGSRGQELTTIGGITFTPLTGHGLWFGRGDGPDWTPLLPGHDLAIDATENMDVSFLPAFSFGFDIAEPTAGPDITPHGFVDSTFTVTLLSGASQVGQFTFNATNDIASFVGVWSDTAFDRVQIRETIGGVEDDYFGHFYSGNTPLPVLYIRSVQPPQVEVSWFTNVIGFSLEGTTNLPTVSWSSVTNAPQVVADRFTVVVPATVPQQFFRLRKP